MRPEDEPELRAIHAQQEIDYQFPDLADELFFVKKVRVVDGRIVGALVLKWCAETMLLLNGEQGPLDKMTTMRELQGAVVDGAVAEGLREIHAAVPAIGFDKRLRELAWERDRAGFELWTHSLRSTT